MMRESFHEISDVDEDQHGIDGLGFDPDRLIETENPASNFEQNDEEIDPDKLIEPVDQFDGLDIEQIDVDEPNSS